MKNVYLGLAVLGTVAPYVLFVQFFATAGLDLGGFLGAVFANPAASGAAADLVIASLVFWVHLFVSGEGRRAWLFIALNLGIGLSCALPAYLYVRWRERSVRAPAPAH